MHSARLNATYRDLNASTEPSLEAEHKTKLHMADVSSAALKAHKFTQAAARTEAGVPTWSESTLSSVKEIGLRTLMGKWQLGRNISLPANCALGLTLQTQMHDEKSPLIAANPYRSNYCLAVKGLSKKTVLWTESKGIMEAGTGLSGTIPIGNFGAIKAGFKPKGLVCYRTLYPHVSGFWSNLKSAITGLGNPLPLSAAHARAMPMGSLFEISASGQLLGEIGLVASAGVGLSEYFMAGASAEIGANKSVGKTHSLEVLALNGSNLFRVTLCEVDDTQNALTALFSAGITANASVIIPPIGSGALKSTMEKLGEAALANTIDAFLKLSVKGSIYHRHADANNLVFVLDIDTKAGADGYNRLVSLDPSSMLVSAQTQVHGIKFLREHVASDEEGKNFQVVLGPQQLFMAQAADIVDNGEISLPDGSKVKHQREIYRRQSGALFWGSKEVSFSTTKMQSSSGIEQPPFWRLTFSEQLSISNQEHVDKFLRVFSALRAKSDLPLHLQCTEMSLLKKVFTGADDLYSCLDICLTDAGIKKICHANAGDAQKAYLAVSYELSEERKPFLLGCSIDMPAKDQAEEIMFKYRELEATTIFNPFTLYDKITKMRLMRIDYERLCMRDLDADLQRMKQASQFADSVDQLKVSGNEAQYQRFFTSLGKQAGFDFEHAFLALCTLAGDDETLIHRLSLKGGGVYLEAKDEGQLTHPREAILQEFDKAP